MIIFKKILNQIKVQVKWYQIEILDQILKVYHNQNNKYKYLYK